MARRRVIETSGRKTRGLTLSREEKIKFEDRCKMEATNKSDKIRNLMIGFIQDFDDTENPHEFLLRYIGGNLELESDDKQKKMVTVAARVSDSIYKDFTEIALAINDTPASLVRKLIRRYLKQDVADYTPTKIKDLRNKRKSMKPM